MSVDYVRPEVENLKPLYRKIRDVLAGPSAVKKAGTLYLPMPDPSEPDREYAVARYDAYKTRAVYFDASGRTHEGFVGQIFYREMQVEINPQLDFMRENVDGQGTSLVQQAKRSVGDVLGLGRAGLLTDYISPERDVTVEDQNKGLARPVIILYETESIINWRWIEVDKVKKLGLLVLMESYDAADDGFETKTSIQYREMRLVLTEFGYVLEVAIWRQQENKNFERGEPTYPKKGDGTPWDEITFDFIGSNDNNPEPDKPPFEGMAEVNIGHYRNSADYEESVFICGQPTPWANGITENWLKEAWRGELRLGCREFIPLPPNGQMGLLEATPNTMAKEAMEAKEKQLVALGAKIAENKSVSTTATEENRDSVIENSTLSSVAKNTSAAYTRALNRACIYVNITEDSVLELNTDFEMTRMSAQDRQQLLAEWQGGGITWEEYRWNLKRSGVAFLDDDKARDLIKEEQQDDINLDPPVEPVPEEV